MGRIYGHKTSGMVLVTNVECNGAMLVEGRQLRGIEISYATNCDDAVRTGWNVMEATALRLTATWEVIMESR